MMHFGRPPYDHNLTAHAQDRQFKQTALAKARWLLEHHLVPTHKKRPKKPCKPANEREN